MIIAHYLMFIKHKSCIPAWSPMLFDDSFERFRILLLANEFVFQFLVGFVTLQHGHAIPCSLLLPELLQIHQEFAETFIITHAVLSYFVLQFVYVSLLEVLISPIPICAPFSAIHELADHLLPIDLSNP